MDNPNVKVKDERIVKLDSIVRDVKQSEEWEAVHMNILEIGEEIGRETMLVEQICCKLKKNKSVKQIAEDLENDETLIAEICNAANGFAPDYDPVQVYQNWKKSRSTS